MKECTRCHKMKPYTLKNMNEWKPEEKKTRTLDEIRDELAHCLNNIEEQMRSLKAEQRAVKESLKAFDKHAPKKP